MDRESLHTLDTLQIHEAAKRNSRGTGRKTEDLGSLVAIKRLEGSPPPYDNWIRAVVTIIFRCSSPFVHIDIRCARNEKFELLLVELRL
jgi:hypothetical protein